jgi:dUTP pyrophosphatase
VRGAAVSDRTPAAARVADVPEFSRSELDVPVRLISPEDAGSSDAPPPGRLPRYALSGDAGADLSLAEDVVLAPFQRKLVGTGVAVAIPEGYAGFVHPRSGLAHRTGLSVVNAPGTIDAGYRGEIKVNLINLDPTAPISLRRGDRIAQLVVQPVVRARFLPVSELPDSERGAGGHGSTGGDGSTGEHDPAAPVGASDPVALEGRF